MNFPRPDLSSLQALNDLTASLQAGATGIGVNTSPEELRNINEELKALRGEAQDDAGLITAVHTAEDGLAELRLEPRAMRMPSEDLAAEIVRLAQAAREDFDAKQREVIESYGPVPEVDLDQARAQIAEIQGALQGGLGDVQALMDRFSDQLKR